MIAAARPETWRVVLAFALAPAVPATVASATTLWDGHDNGGWFGTWKLYAVVGGYLPALLLGLPAWFVLRNRVAPGYGAAMLAGAIVAALPWVLLALLAGNPDNASQGGVVTVVDGTRTLGGWIALLRSVGLIAALGALGGVVFRVVVHGRRS
ncbi:hypothetical protein [Glacieibacterium frigidum]|uniref:Uncharacterized protein n=1 Tax=Glacieibacterium frigidum TaxID=2593303 RepID=A0A552UAH8_9SPHN|nr:hypothetical protein [Glacieibacterium frigidum]TRW15199.1 hypothetical protein FMM06_16320 [Glacieibacterium frigidum]